MDHAMSRSKKVKNQMDHPPVVAVGLLALSNPTVKPVVAAFLKSGSQSQIQGGVSCSRYRMVEAR